jgi:hypothetical protein
MKHPENIIENEPTFETGEGASYLRYDSLEDLLSGMAKGLIDQSEKDERKERPVLARLGREAAEKIDQAKEIIAKMWKISEPYMKDKDKL